MDLAAPDQAANRCLVFLVLDARDAHSACYGCASRYSMSSLMCDGGTFIPYRFTATPSRLTSILT